VDPIDSIAGISPLAEPLSEMPVCEALNTDTAAEDISMDMEPPHDLSQPTFPTVLSGLGDEVTWYSGDMTA
jgi:hypothetical protein